MRIVIGGTRYHLTPAHQALISRALGAAVTQSVLGVKPALITGCCKTGVDQYVRQWALNHGWQVAIIPAAQASAHTYLPGTLTVITAHGRNAEALTMRTVTMASLGNQVLSFPLSSAYQKSGSWLLAHTASIMHKTLGVIMPPTWQGQLPTCHNISSWQSLQAGGFFGGFCTGFSVWRPIIQQVSLF